MAELEVSSPTASGKKDLFSNVVERLRKQSRRNSIHLLPPAAAVAVATTTPKSSSSPKKKKQVWGAPGAAGQPMTLPDLIEVNQQEFENKSFDEITFDYAMFDTHTTTNDKENNQKTKTKKGKEEDEEEDGDVVMSRRASTMSATSPKKSKKKKKSKEEDGDHEEDEGTPKRRYTTGTMISRTLLEELENMSPQELDFVESLVEESVGSLSKSIDKTAATPTTPSSSPRRKSKKESLNGELVLSPETPTSSRRKSSKSKKKRSKSPDKKTRKSVTALASQESLLLSGSSAYDEDDDQDTVLLEINKELDNTKSSTTKNSQQGHENNDPAAPRVETKHSETTQPVSSSTKSSQRKRTVPLELSFSSDFEFEDPFAPPQQQQQQQQGAPPSSSPLKEVKVNIQSPISKKQEEKEQKPFIQEDEQNNVHHVSPSRRRSSSPKKLKSHRKSFTSSSNSSSDNDLLRTPKSSKKDHKKLDATVNTTPATVQSESPTTSEEEKTKERRRSSSSSSSSSSIHRTPKTPKSSRKASVSPSKRRVSTTDIKSPPKTTSPSRSCCSSAGGKKRRSGTTDMEESPIILPLAPNLMITEDDEDDDDDNNNNNNNNVVEEPTTPGGGKKKKKKKSTKKKKSRFKCEDRKYVDFSAMEIRIYIEHFNDMSTKEKNRIWYTQDELTLMELESNIAIEVMEKSGMKKVKDSRDFTLRGLEQLTKEGKEQALQCRRGAQRTCLKVQKEQRKQNIYDPERIAKLCQMQSFMACKRASQRGLKDAKAAQKYLSKTAAKWYARVNNCNNNKAETSKKLSCYDTKALYPGTLHDCHLEEPTEFTVDPTETTYTEEPTDSDAFFEDFGLQELQFRDTKSAAAAAAAAPVESSLKMPTTSQQRETDISNVSTTIVPLADNDDDNDEDAFDANNTSVNESSQQTPRQDQAGISSNNSKYLDMSATEDSEETLSNDAEEKELEGDVLVPFVDELERKRSGDVHKLEQVGKTISKRSMKGTSTAEAKPGNASELQTALARHRSTITWEEGDTCLVVEVPHHSSYNEEEHHAMWYTDSETDAMVQERKRIAKLFQEGKLKESDDETRRGLEFDLEKQRLQTRRRRVKGRNVVLGLQDKYFTISGEVDEKSIAIAYSTVADECRAIANATAKKDEADVASYLLDNEKQS